MDASITYLQRLGCIACAIDDHYSWPIMSEAITSHVHAILRLRYSDLVVR